MLACIGTGDSALRTYRVGMYPTKNVNPVKGDVVERLIEVEDDERGEHAASKAALYYPDMSVLYVGLKDHDK